MGVTAETSGKTAGQIDYERFCEREYQQHGRVWNRWETLPHEEKARWEASAMRWGPQA